MDDDDFEDFDVDFEEVDYDNEVEDGFVVDESNKQYTAEKDYDLIYQTQLRPADARRILNGVNFRLVRNLVMRYPDKSYISDKLKSYGLLTNSESEDVDSKVLLSSEAVPVPVSHRNRQFLNDMFREVYSRTSGWAANLFLALAKHRTPTDTKVKMYIIHRIEARYGPL